MKLHVTVFLDHFCLNSHSRKVILTTFSALLKSVKHFLTHFRLFFYCYYTHWFLHVLHYERYLLVCSCTSHLNMTTHQNRLFVLFLVSTLDFWLSSLLSSNLVVFSIKLLQAFLKYVWKSKSRNTFSENFLQQIQIKTYSLVSQLLNKTTSQGCSTRLVRVGGYAF